MPHPRTIRAWLRRGNLALTALLVWVAIDALTFCPEELAPMALPASAAREPWDLVERPVEDLDEMLALVHLFHPPGARRCTPPSEPAEPTRLPLRAFRVGMVVRQDGAADTLTLISKDPARKESYFLSGHEPDEDCVLVSARYEGSLGHFRVRRGDEEFTFRYRFDDQPVIAAIRPVGGWGQAQRAGASGDLRSDPVPVLAVAKRAIKGLPFYGTRGKLAGFRVTGVRPGSWAKRLGVQPGDVITTAEDRQVKDAVGFRTRLASGWEPARLVVRRGVGKNTQRLTLAGS